MTLATDTVTVAGAETAAWTSPLVSVEQCDPRRVRRIIGEFTGYYTRAFEVSEFEPCPQSEWVVDSDTLGRGGRAWARRAWLSYASRDATRGVTWPSGVEESEWGGPRYWVRVRGTIEGPGQYGHMGVSAFLLQVDSIVEVADPRHRTCDTAP